jgi:hypothetical protein
LVREARRSAGLTQAEFARRARTSQSAVAAYESGAKIPSAETLARLLRAAGRRLQSAPAPGGGRRTGRLSRLIRTHRDEILATANEHHATKVRVFGSVARNDERTGSDIDLLVDMEPGRSLLDQVRLRRALTELLGVEVDVVTSGGLLKRDSSIVDDAVPL